MKKFLTLLGIVAGLTVSYLASDISEQKNVVEFKEHLVSANESPSDIVSLYNDGTVYEKELIDEIVNLNTISDTSFDVGQTVMIPVFE